MKNAGMPAMPVDGTLRGLSKREHFAGLALMGLVAARGQHDVTDAKEIVEDAVTFADALLAELGREAT